MITLLAKSIIPPWAAHILGSVHRQAATTCNGPCGPGSTTAGLSGSAASDALWDLIEVWSRCTQAFGAHIVQKIPDRRSRGPHRAHAHLRRRKRPYPDGDGGRGNRASGMYCPVTPMTQSPQYLTQCVAEGRVSQMLYAQIKRGTADVCSNRAVRRGNGPPCSFWICSQEPRAAGWLIWSRRLTRPCLTLALGCGAFCGDHARTARRLQRLALSA